MGLCLSRVLVLAMICRLGMGRRTEIFVYARRQGLSKGYASGLAEWVTENWDDIKAIMEGTYFDDEAPSSS